jgi:hypothetical protein
VLLQRVEKRLKWPEKRPEIALDRARRFSYSPASTMLFEADLQRSIGGSIDSSQSKRDVQTIHVDRSCMGKVDRSDLPADHEADPASKEAGGTLRIQKVANQIGG